jgi:hypothetical protein
MSEYQYYEFLALDRPLDERQRAELRALSTRARITATSFVNEYHWGDFRGNPAALMERYFDAFLYLANWGTRRLMIRLPRGLLDLGVAERYCTGDAASSWAAGDHVILSLSSEDEDEYWEEGEGRLASIALVRSELAAGDLRLLYLAWLLSVQAEEVGDEEAEPPLPPGLRALSAPLQAVADFLRIDEDLLTAAAAASAEVQSQQASWAAGSKICPVRRRMPCSCRRRAEKAAGFRRSCSAASAPNGPRAARLPMPEHVRPGSCGTRRPPGARNGNGSPRSGEPRNRPAKHTLPPPPGSSAWMPWRSGRSKPGGRWTRSSAPRSRANTTRQSPSCWTCRHLPNAMATATRSAGDSGNFVNSISASQA